MIWKRKMNGCLVVAIGAGLLVGACVEYGQFRSGEECRTGDERIYVCEGGGEVAWCICDGKGRWECIAAPEDQCRECEPGRVETYTCPDGQEVLWCTCNESGVLDCIEHPEERCYQCEPGSQETYSCPDGQEVLWCTCSESGILDCIENPEVQCDPCEPESVQHITCPDGGMALWCTCEESGEQYCVDIPGEQCHVPCVGAGGYSWGSWDHTCCTGLVAFYECSSACVECDDPTYFQCLPCGNGSCQGSLGENWCNCPEDCPYE